MDPFWRRSPAGVYIPQKPHPNGHLVYKGVNINSNTNLPYLYHMLPYFGGKHSDTKDVMESMIQKETPRTIIANSWFPSQSKCHPFKQSNKPTLHRKCRTIGRKGLTVYDDVSKGEI